MIYIMKDRKIYGISNVLEHEDGFYYVLAYTTQDKKADLVSTRVEEDGTQVYKSINSILLISWEKDTLDPVMSAPWCDSFLFSKKSDGEIVPNEKIYGISDIVKHSQGFNYVCAYLDKKKNLGNALLLLAWLDSTGEPLCMNDYADEQECDNVNELENTRNVLDRIDSNVAEKRYRYHGYFSNVADFSEHLKLELLSLTRRCKYLSELISKEKDLNTDIEKQIFDLNETATFLTEISRFVDYLKMKSNAKPVNCCECGKEVNIPIGIEEDLKGHPFGINLSGDEVPNGACAFEEFHGFYCQDCFDKAVAEWNKEWENENKEWVEYRERCEKSRTGMVCCVCGKTIYEPYSLEKDSRSCGASTISCWYYCSRKCEEKVKNLNKYDEI